VIGRDAEVDAVLDVFSRRRANNPVLVGAPGVGKTAVAEAVAQRLADGGVGITGLEGAHLVELSAGALVSGTGVRGALADRMKKLRAEVAEAEGKILLFIDELHAVVGGGEGPDDLAHELKASLARGELPVLGATTQEEFDKYISRDPALARRFSPVHVEEPSEEVTLAILKGLAPRYERHHRAAFHPAALRAAVELSARYIPERQLPDKAVATLDLAAARVRRRGGDVVDAAAVASVVAERARVPVERLLRDDGERLIELEQTLATRVVGHGAMLERVSDALRKGAAGFHGARPLATFLFLGPTGVGKTETAKAIADTFFPGSGMTRVDMSELSEAHAVSRLLGAPPGYVGYDRGGVLTEAVRRRPYQLLLLDEMEKAHPDVLLSLLPLLDEGRMTDGRGRTVDFRNTVIVMTSNLGVSRRSASIGFGGSGTNAASSDEVLAAARRALPPELFNRIDEPLVFAPLTREDVAEIARRMLRGVGDTLEREHGIELLVEESAIDALIEAGGFDPELGARPMRRVIGRLVEAALARGVLSGEHRPGEALSVRGEGAHIHLVPACADAAE
ncbi:MAG: ATP-dependent Clp protease ATP-binding subunit, partial [Deltaproteobacteria bacterium]|nr:ATP-dependent Clp protease ATP-binding subunit [Deltaproteobacteria bacterium]